MHLEYTPRFPVLDHSAYINLQHVIVCRCSVCVFSANKCATTCVRGEVGILSSDCEIDWSCLCVCVCIFSGLMFVNPTNRSPPTRSRPRSRSIPLRCVATVWWPRRFRPAPSWPAAPAAPAPSSAECLQENMGCEDVFLTDTVALKIQLIVSKMG